MDVDQRAEIGDEFHRTGQAVVESRLAARPRFRPARAAATARRGPGVPPVQASASPPAVRKRPGASTRAVEEGAAADEAGDEAVGRPLVEVALAADLADRALVHHHQPVGHGQRLLLVVRHHHGGEAELALQLADLDPHLLAQLGVEIGERLVEQQHVGPDGQRAGQRHALLLAAGELARQARRRSRRAAPARSASSTRVSISAFGSLRISRPKATFCATVMCGNSA